MKTLVWLVSFAAVLLFGFYVLKPRVERGFREAGWHFTLPPIARGMELTGRDAYLTGRVQKAFPAGTPQSRLVRDLSRQGFEIDAPRGDADYKWLDYSCLCHLRVHWEPPGDKDSPIEKIDALVDAEIL